jgi:hypothetical protein
MWKKLLKALRKKPVAFEDFSRTEPVSRLFGFDRGTPIDRYYIDKFLAEHCGDIHGKTLEIAESVYSKKYGSNVTDYEILHYDNSNRDATIIGDLTDKATLPEGKIDCFICTQTLNFIYDVQKAIEGCYTIAGGGGGTGLYGFRYMSDLAV